MFYAGIIILKLGNNKEGKEDIRLLDMERGSIVLVSFHINANGPILIQSSSPSGSRTSPPLHMAMAAPPPTPFLQ
jgi:hypothetical protein